jgi:hypothetical protein
MTGILSLALRAKQVIVRQINVYVFVRPEFHHRRVKERIPNAYDRSLAIQYISAITGQMRRLVGHPVYPDLEVVGRRNGFFPKTGVQHVIVLDAYDGVGLGVRAGIIILVIRKDTVRFKGTHHLHAFFEASIVFEIAGA